MTILHIIDSAGLYGAEMVVLALMEEQRRSGLKPILCSIGAKGVLEKAIESEARTRGLQVQAFRMRNGPNLAGALSIMSYAREQGVEILHSHGYKGNILFGLLPRSVRRLPLVATLHGWSNRGGLSKIGLYEWLDARVLRSIDGVVVVSAAMLENPKLAGRTGLPLRVIPNAVLPAGDGQANGLDNVLLEFCERAITIGSIGRLVPEKGHQLLIKALAKLRADGLALQTVILGEGPQRKALERLITELDLGDVVLLPGFRRNARAYLPSFGLFALPSYTEGMPITLLETMHSGTPIVAAAVGGIPEMLRDGAAGLLFEKGDLAGLTSAIHRILEDAATALNRAKHAREIVAGEFSIEKLATEYSDLYSEVLDRV